MTNKKEWDKFDRSTKTALKFPSSLAPMLKHKKHELFNLWLDNGMDWDKVTCHVEREQATKNLSRKQWTAIQAKVLKEKLTPERFEEIIKKRMDAGLFYKDDDYPNDPLDRVSASLVQ